MSGSENNQIVRNDPKRKVHVSNILSEFSWRETGISPCQGEGFVIALGLMIHF